MEFAAVALWWLLLVALGAAGLPVAATVLRRLPDRGAGLALPVGVAVFAMAVYWLGHVRYGPVVALLGVFVLVCASAALSRNGVALAPGRFGEAMAVFTAAFLLLVAVRAVDPSIQSLGGEKFLDYGLLNSLLRARRLPPEDMWFAGEPVQYYYGGHLIAASLTMLTGTAARFAYNLALAGFFGMLVSAAYGVAGNVAAARGASYRLAGLLGAAFVGVASNLVVPVSVLLWALPGSLSAAAAAALGEVTALPPARLAGPDAFFYWTASRVIRGTINEFPLFAFLNGDLHAHMMSTPFLVLVAGLGLAYVRTPPGDRRARRLLVFGAVPPVAGLLAVVNTWSFPTAVGVTVLAVLFAGSDPVDLLPERTRPRFRADTAGRGEAGRIAAATVAGLGVATLGVLWALPFFAGPATGAGGRTLGLLPPRSGLVEFSLVHGWWLLVYGLYLGARALDARSGTDVTPAFSLGSGRAAVLVAVAAVLLLVAEAAAVALVIPPMAAAWWLLRRREGTVGFEAVLFVAGAGLVLLVEFAYVAEQAGPGRMNTVFKTYMQVWVLWASGAAVALAFLLRPASRRAGSAWRSPRVRTALGVLLVVSTSLYAGFALAAHAADAGEPTLDATVDARATHPEQWAAIEFLAAQEGQPRIVTAPGCWCNPDGLRPYDWMNAPSSFTGLPTLAGWSHEVGYRDQATYDERRGDVETIYTGTWAERAPLLAEHEVRFVYVGPNERALYGDIAVTDDHPALSVAYRNDAVTIYAVDRGAL